MEFSNLLLHTKFFVQFLFNSFDLNSWVKPTTPSPSPFCSIILFKFLPVTAYVIFYIDEFMITILCKFFIYYEKSQLCNYVLVFYVPIISYLSLVRKYLPLPFLHSIRNYENENIF